MNNSKQSARLLKILQKNKLRGQFQLLPFVFAKYIDFVITFCINAKHFTSAKRSFHAPREHLICRGKFHSDASHRILRVADQDNPSSLKCPSNSLGALYFEIKKALSSRWRTNVRRAEENVLENTRFRFYPKGMRHTRIFASQSTLSLRLTSKLVDLRSG